MFNQVDQRVLRIGAPLFHFKQVVGEQNLSDLDVPLSEKVAIETHQAGLPDGGGHLQTGQGVGAGVEPKRLDARGDGAGGDENHFASGFVCDGNSGNE